MDIPTLRDGGKWAFLADKGFMSVLDKEIRLDVTEEVIEKMYREYLLCVGSYNISSKPDGSYSVVFNNADEEHDEYVVSRDSDGALRCKCMGKIGYPCRHIFAVARHLNIQVTRSIINSRFYLRQSDINMDEENKKAPEIVIQSTQLEKERDSILPHMKLHAGLSSYTEEGGNIFAALDKYLAQSKEARIGTSIEAIQKMFSRPQPSSSPGVAEEEEREIASLRAAVEASSYSDSDSETEINIASDMTSSEKEKWMNEPVSCRDTQKMSEKDFEAFSKCTRDGKISILMGMFNRLTDEMSPEMMDKYFRVLCANYMELRSVGVAAELQASKIEGGPNKNSHIKVGSDGNPEISSVKKEFSGDKKPFLIKEERSNDSPNVNTAGNSSIICLVGDNGQISDDDDGCCFMNVESHLSGSDRKICPQNKPEKDVATICDEPDKKKCREAK